MVSDAFDDKYKQKRDEMKVKLDNDFATLLVFILLTFFVVTLFKMVVIISSYGWFWLLSAFIVIIYSIVVALTVMVLYAISGMIYLPDDEE